jgi:hypothetical protein
MIYFIRSGQFVKVGVSEQPWKRLSNLQTAHHDHLEMLAIMPGDRAFEQRLHKRFAEYRHNREWFRDSDPLQQYIQEVRELYADIQDRPEDSRVGGEPVEISHQFGTEAINRACSCFDLFYQSGGQVEYYDFPDKFIIGLPGSSYEHGYNPLKLYSISYDDGSATPKLGREMKQRTLTHRLNEAMMMVTTFHGPDIAIRDDYGVFMRFNKAMA